MRGLMVLTKQVFLLAVALAASAPAAASSVSCKPAPGACTFTCAVRESAPEKGGALHVDIEGTCADQVITNATYDLKMEFDGVPFLSAKGEDASKETTFSLPRNMANITIPAVKLPVNKGQNISVPAVVDVGEHVPDGNHTVLYAAYDGSKVHLVSVKVEMLFGRGFGGGHVDAAAITATAHVSSQRSIPDAGQWDWDRDGDGGWNASAPQSRRKLERIDRWRAGSGKHRGGGGRPIPSPSPPAQDSLGDSGFTMSEINP